MDDTLTDWQIMKITEIEIRTMPRFASLLCLEVELVFKELNHFGAIALFFRDWTPGTLTGGVYINVSSVVAFQRWWVLKSKLFAKESTS